MSHPWKTGSTEILIKEPRYHDKTVLLATYKISPSNLVVIQKGAYAGKYRVSGEEATKHPLTTNGSIAVRAVPLEKLERIE